MSDEAAVLMSTDGAVATITLNRPKARNAFNKQLRIELGAAMQAAEDDADIRCVVITGEGKGFSAGHDLTDGFGGFDRISQCIDAEYKPFLDTPRQSEKLYFAAVNGIAAGIGGALAMACDFTVMGESSSIYQAFLPIALVPDGGASWHLVRAMGYKRALQTFLEAERISAQRCIELGLANKVVGDEEVVSATQAWAAQLAEGAPIAQRLTKQLLQQAMEADLDAIIDSEAKAQDICSMSNDSRAAGEAFFAKTKPVFTGT